MKKITLSATDGEFNFPLDGGECKYLVLYFYPKDATPGCTTEGHEFSKLLPKFNKSGVAVYGVSRDSLASHEKFKAKQNYTVDLIADSESLLCDFFKVVKLKKNFGKEYMGIERSTFIVNSKAEIIKEWRKVKVVGHAQEVLDEVEKL